MKLVPEHPEDPNSQVTQEQVDRAYEGLWRAYCDEIGKKCDAKPPKGWDPYDAGPQPPETTPAPGLDDAKPVAPLSCRKSEKGDQDILKCFPPLKIED